MSVSGRKVILVVGVTPCLQRILTFDRLVPGEVNRAKSVTLTTGGKGSNVAHDLVRLGCEAVLVGPRGGSAGRQFGQMLSQDGVLFVGPETVSETRTCSTLRDLASGTVTELVEESGSLDAADWTALETEVKSRLPDAQILLLAGKLPPNTPVDAYARLIRLARETGVPALLDTHGEPAMAAASLRPLFIKMNAAELAATVGSADAAEIVAAGAEWVVVTRGPDPAWLVGKKGRWQYRLPNLTPVNPIGCGDAMLAGTAAALAKGSAMPEAVRYGLGCGCAKALESSTWGFDEERAAQFAAEVAVVSR